MRKIQPTLLLACLAGLIGLQIGCGGGSGGANGPAYLGSGNGTVYIWTELSTGAWQQAAVSGFAIPFTYSCDPSTDGYCTASFGQTVDGTNGELIFSTDALPASWSFAAEADPNCEVGATYGPQSISSGMSPTLICGTQTYGSMTATPGQCTDTMNDNTGEETSNCPANITVSSSAPLLPTTYALTVSNYSDMAEELYSTPDTATSPTSITVTTPSAYGTTVLTVVDPTTNLVLGAATFLRSHQIILPGK